MRHSGFNPRNHIFIPPVLRPTTVTLRNHQPGLF